MTTAICIESEASRTAADAICHQLAEANRNAAKGDGVLFEPNLTPEEIFAKYSMVEVVLQFHSQGQRVAKYAASR